MITPPKTKDNLAIAAARMKRAAPNSFKEFEEAFEALWAEGVVRCVQSPRDDVLNNQGRAQQLTEVRDVLRECLVTADKISAKLKEQK